eukprot:gene28208-34063_t
MANSLSYESWDGDEPTQNSQLNGSLTQTAGSATLLNVACGTISKPKLGSQPYPERDDEQRTRDDHYFQPSRDVTVPSATTSSDFSITGDGRLLQDLTSSTVNQIKSSNIKSITLEGNLTQAAGVSSLKMVTADSLDTKAFNLLDSGGAVVVSDTEMRLLDGVTSNIQGQLNDLATDVGNFNDHVSTNAETIDGEQVVTGDKRFDSAKAKRLELQDEDASIRTNRLNTFAVARFQTNNRAAVNAGTFGQNQTQSVKVYHGNFTDGTHVEITSSIYS